MRDLREILSLDSDKITINGDRVRGYKFSTYELKLRIKQYLNTIL